MGSVFFTSDTHFGHANIIKYSDRPHHAFAGRPLYSSVEEMGEEFVKNYNSVVGPDDICYHLGDVGMGTVDGWSHYIKRLNGLRCVIRGNHDPTKTKLLEAGFHFAEEQYYLVHGGVTLWLAHIPINNTSDKRNLVRPPALMPYDIALCGHVHERWTVGPAGEINVGVDRWKYTPVEIDEVVATFALEIDEELENAIELSNADR